jgi:hypothetical protein
MRKPRISSHGLAFFAVFALGPELAACRGCGSTATPAAVASELPIEAARRADLLARFADLKIDRSRMYPKNERGVVTCGDDANCFVAQAETCTRAELSIKLTDSGYGIHNVVDAVYTINGIEAEQCRLRRQVRTAKVHLDQPLVAALRADGHNEADVQRQRAMFTKQLRQRTPVLLDCWFSSDDVLEVTLDLASKRFNDKLFRLNCHESNENVPPLPPAGGGQDAAGPDAATRGTPPASP